MVESFLAGVKGDVQVVSQPNPALLLIDFASQIEAGTHDTHPLLKRQHLQPLIMIRGICYEVAAEVQGGV